MVSTSSHETEYDHQLSRQPEKSARGPIGRDVEQGAPSSGPETSAAESPQEKGEDQWVVGWNGSDDPEDPLNTPGWQKW